jgi:hypothetical protein
MRARTVRRQGWGGVRRSCTYPTYSVTDLTNDQRSAARHCQLGHAPKTEGQSIHHPAVVSWCQRRAFYSPLSWPSTNPDSPWALFHALGIHARSTHPGKLLVVDEESRCRWSCGECPESDSSPESETREHVKQSEWRARAGCPCLEWLACAPSHQESDWERRTAYAAASISRPVSALCICFAAKIAAVPITGGTASPMTLVRVLFVGKEPSSYPNRKESGNP